MRNFKISKLVAKIIQNDSVSVEVFQNSKFNPLYGDISFGKYGYLISREDSSYVVFLVTEAYANTQEQAKRDGEELLKKIKEANLSKVAEYLEI